MQIKKNWHIETRDRGLLKLQMLQEILAQKVCTQSPYTIEPQ